MHKFSDQFTLQLTISLKELVKKKPRLYQNFTFYVMCLHGEPQLLCKLLDHLRTQIIINQILLREELH